MTKFFEYIKSCEERRPQNMIRLKTIGSAVYGTKAGNSFINPASNFALKHINIDKAACEQDLVYYVLGIFTVTPA
jgi:hypothetical protein